MQVKDILEINKQERHIRGGLATKRKYEEYSKRMQKNSEQDKQTCSKTKTCVHKLCVHKL